MQSFMYGIEEEYENSLFANLLDDIDLNNGKF
jgi:hypothetical protein